MLDLLIRGGMVADGTGAPLRRADVGVRDGRVTVVADAGERAGTADIEAEKVVDAEGLFVAPGFVDLHTHYDAQLSWDPAASPSPLHGVTTVFGGNCGFSLAPCREEDAEYLTALLARVEGMPLAALEAGLDWQWRSFGDWLGRLDGRVGVNAGFLAGHSTLRRSVMGERAVGEVASDADVALMVQRLGEALADGAIGFSTSQAHTHHDGAGQPVPSRAALRPEMEALASAVRDFPGTTVELVLSGSLNGFSDEEVDLMSSMSLGADRPVNWNVLGVSAADPAATEHQLAASDEAAKRGATVVALTLPHTMRIRLSFATGVILDGLPGWREVLSLPPAERMAALSDPEVRRRLNAGAQSDDAGILRHLAVWRRLVFEETFAPQNASCEGRRVGDVAAERGQDPFDAMLDVVVADGLRTGLRPPIPESEEDWAARGRIWTDRRAVVGGSDAGAHLDTMCGAVYSTALLGQGVREHGVISWEEAVHQLTDVPARLYGLKGRGRIAPGWWADLVVFDPATVGPGPERTRDDLPGGSSRLYAEATGIEHVLVNGTEVVSQGAATGALPGRVLRSGRDTVTVRAGTDWWTGVG
ncbi:MAG: amidohydrolase family protein [Actinomycetota bacterium]|jgi:N-acyl-D-aspartate/D-glutamate deacylase|nr:amidohydrolase family protein [Actinomycetota bacterium]